MHLIPAGWNWRTTTPGGHGRTRGLRGDGHAEAARAQDVGRTLAVEADQIGHQIGRPILATIHEQPHLHRLRRKGVDPGRRQRRRHSSTIGSPRSRPMVKPSCDNRISAERCWSPTSAGASAMWGPELSHRRSPRCRRTAEPGAGSWPSTCPAGTFRSERLPSSMRTSRSRVRPREASSIGLPMKLGTVTCLALTAMPMPMAANRRNVPRARRSTAQSLPAVHTRDVLKAASDESRPEGHGTTGYGTTNVATPPEGASRSSRNGHVWCMRANVTSGRSRRKASIDLLVFLGLARTGAVNHEAAWPHEVGGSIQQYALGGGKSARSAA